MKRVLLQHLLLRPERLCAQQQSGAELGAQALRVTQGVLGIEVDPLALLPEDALDVAERKPVVLRDRLERAAHQRGEEPRRHAPVDADRLRVGEEALQLVVAAHDLAARAVQRFDPLVLGAGDEHVRDPRGGGALALHVHHGAGVRGLPRRGRRALQPDRADRVPGSAAAGKPAQSASAGSAAASRLIGRPRPGSRPAGRNPRWEAGGGPPRTRSRCAAARRWRPSPARRAGADVATAGPAGMPRSCKPIQPTTATVATEAAAAKAMRPALAGTRHRGASTVGSLGERIHDPPGGDAPAGLFAPQRLADQVVGTATCSFSSSLPQQLRMARSAS